MIELKDYYAEPIKVFADSDNSIEHDFFYDLVYKYGKAIRRAAQLGGRYVEAMQTLLDMEWSMVYGSVMRDSTTKVTITREDDAIHVAFLSRFIYD